MAARFRINPVEIVIFALVFSGFCLSLYGLYRQTSEFRQSTLTRVDTPAAERAPASIVEPDALKLEIPCAKNPGFSLPNTHCN